MYKYFLLFAIVFNSILILKPAQATDCCEQFTEQIGKGEYSQVLESGKPLLNRLTGRQKFELLVVLGSASFQLGRYTESADYWRQGIELEPREYGLKINLAQAYINKGNSENAVNVLTEIPDDRLTGEKSALMGNIAFAGSDYGRAIEYYEASLPLLPEKWQQSVKRNLVFSYDNLSRQLTALVGDLSDRDRAQILAQIDDIGNKLNFYTKNNDDLAILIWQWKQNKSSHERIELLTKVRQLPLSLQKGNFLLTLGEYQEARQVAEFLDASDLLVDILISEAEEKNSTDILVTALRIAELEGNWYNLFKINYIGALKNITGGNRDRAERQLVVAYQNLIRFTQLNALSGERKLYVSQFFDDAISFIFESEDPENLLFLRSLLINNQILQVALFYNIPCSINSATDTQKNTDLVLYYFFDDKNGYMLSDLNGKIAKKKLLVSESEMTELVAKWRNDLRDVRNDRYIASGERIYHVLLDSIDLEGVNQVGVVVDPLLQSVPFAALYDGKKFLIERFPVIYLSRDLNSTIASGGNILAMGASTFSDNVKALPFAAREIEDAVSIVGGDALIDRDFTEGNIIRQLEKTRYAAIHVATHGFFGGNADLSWLQTYDSRLSVSNLSQILSENSPFNLLVLSGCETGRGNSSLVYGLAGIGLKLGIQSVIGTQWPVGDGDASELMVAFYKSLKKGHSPAEAMREAQIAALKNPAQHPNNWAGFIVLN